MKQKVNRETMRQNNLLLIFEAIYRKAGITKSGLSGVTEISAMAVGRIVDFLLERGLILDETGAGGDIGRPAKRLRVNDRLLSVGVSLDQNGAFIGAVNPYGKLCGTDRYLFEPERMSYGEALQVTARLIRRFLAEQGLPGVHAVGLTLPGLIDPGGRRVRFSYPLKWEDVPAADILEGQLPVQVILDNDIKARAGAESRFGSGKGHARSVLLNIGSGVGAGIVIDGEIYRGKEDLAGEIGHVSLGLNSKMCVCGRSGCLEATISQPAVLQEAGMVIPDIDMEGLEAEYQKGARWAKTLLNMTAEQIFLVISLLAGAYAPDALILCGSLIDRCGALREIIAGLYGARHLKMFNNHFKLEFSAFGPGGNVMGAAVSAFNHNVRQAVFPVAEPDPVSK